MARGIVSPKSLTSAQTGFQPQPCSSPPALRNNLSQSKSKARNACPSLRARMKNLGRSTSSWEPFLLTRRKLKERKVARKSVSKEALVRKEVYESRRGDEMTNPTIYTFRARRSVQRFPQI